jgi:hypothetical protein
MLANQTTNNTNPATLNQNDPDPALSAALKARFMRTNDTTKVTGPAIAIITNGHGDFAVPGRLGCHVGGGNGPGPDGELNGAS